MDLHTMHVESFKQLRLSDPSKPSAYAEARARGDRDDRGTGDLVRCRIGSKAHDFEPFPQLLVKPLVPNEHSDAYWLFEVWF